MLLRRFPLNSRGLPRVIRIVSLPDETDLPDEMTIADFRVLANAQRAKIIVDDDSGGSPVRSPTPELVS